MSQRQPIGGPPSDTWAYTLKPFSFRVSSIKYSIYLRCDLYVKTNLSVSGLVWFSSELAALKPHLKNNSVNTQYICTYFYSHITALPNIFVCFLKFNDSDIAHGHYIEVNTRLKRSSFHHRDPYRN